MSQLRTWRKRLAAALEWSAVDKGMVLMAMLIPLYVQQLLWGLYVLSRQDRVQLVNVAVITENIQYQLLLILLGGLIVLAGCAIRRRRPDLLLFQHVSLQYFALSLVLSSYSIGTVSFPTGIVLLGAPIFGFILLDRLAVWLASASALTLLLGLSYASAFGLLPYAPARLPPTDAASNLFWMNSDIFFAAPFMILITFLADQMLSWWREREDKIRRLSRTDALTGLHNRRSIMELLDQELARRARHEEALSVVILDLDHFKKVNDTWGHPTGDRVLQKAAAVLRESVREGDHVGRYGGEEFMILLPATTLTEAGKVLERCRVRLTEADVLSDSRERVIISASFGLTCHVKPEEVAAQLLIQCADEALYQAKANGRNRIETLLPTG